MNLVKLAMVLWMSTGTVFSALPGFTAPPELTGKWAGKGTVIVSWCEKVSLDFSISISSDGKVVGMIGDAVLENGTIRRNNWLLRLLNNPEFIVEGDLSGPLVTEEGIVRNSAKYLMLDIESPNQLSGGFHSSGKHVGGKDSMMFTVFGINLERLVR